MTSGPLFSIITPVYDPPPRFLDECIASVVKQTFDNWEWCIADDGSTNPVILQRLQRLAAEDPRVKVCFREANGGIVPATNSAFALATGEFVALLGHDDELEHHALAVMADLVAAEPDLDYAYSDESVWDTNQGRYIRWFKPGWSIERMRCQNYANHLSVFRRSLVEQVGAWLSGTEGAQDHSLILRVSEHATNIRHVPQSLYRWKTTPGSTVGDASAKPYAFENGLKAVQDHCDRIGIDAEVVHGPDLGIYRLKRRVTGEPLVSVVIPSNAPVGEVREQEWSFLEQTVRGVLEHTDYPHVEIIVVPDPQTSSEVLERTRLQDTSRVRITPAVPRPFNFSRKTNLGAAYARGEYLLFLNDDVEITHSDWLGNMLAIAQQPGIGAVGAKLVFENGTMQHAGVYLWHGPGHFGFGIRQQDSGFLGMWEVDRDCVAVTGACLLTSADVFSEVGGMTMSLASNWQDVDFCLKLRTIGLRSVWTPQAVLTHFESITRDPKVLDTERMWLQSRWARELMTDPYFSPADLQVGPMWPVEWYR